MTIIRTSAEGSPTGSPRAAEVLHAHVRSSFWGYAPEEHFTTQQWIRENHVGIRPAIRPAPTIGLKPTLSKMLGGAPAGITSPTISRRKLTRPSHLFRHRDSQYFGVARIGRPA
jgi:5-methyltetrahydrofolate--homocysteine methyltransferase